jgi:alpha-amylase/alpha-mannosidase (GH57 family)
MSVSDAVSSVSVATTESISGSIESISPGEVSTRVDSLRCATGVYVTVHGHFYQPPRENPYLGTIERQRSANPFHDWNERIYHECYRPNAFARILNNRGEIVGIVNNYEYLSFNIGPTLMSWLERHDVEVYQRILEADRKSCDRLNGHGNAIAQVYNHIILPLANQRDKYTQIRWGKADFRSRFGRDPEGMWLAETAVDADTLEALVAEGIRFIILAPSQAQRCRPLPGGDQAAAQWYEVGGGQIDPTRPYRCFLPGSASEESGSSHPYIDIFFYDGPISGDMGFGETLSSSQYFAGRIGQAVRGDRKPAQLIAVATDGETFGHHKQGTERALAYALVEEFPQRGWTVTNFAHYLSLNPPTWEVELKPVTAWSCAHGVDRWQENCGCGGGGVWHQKWRRPLRDTLNWLRDQLSQVYVETGERLFKAPWQARDEYIEVIHEQGLLTFPKPNVEASDPVDRFLARHQTHPLTEIERVNALRLLEMQRYALLMFTSCGWFFEEISRPEGVQILRYATRALELAGDVAGVQLEAEFVQRLAQAPSNIDWFKNGAEVYRQLVAPAQISLHQVAAHYAISSLFTPYPQQHQVYCYIAHQLDYQLQRMGSLTLAVGQLQLVSEITHETVHLVFAVLHLGGWDFHCCIQPFSGRQRYSQIKASLLKALQQASAAQTILTMTQEFGSESYGLHNLFAEERHRIMRLLTQETSTRLDQLYTQVYRDNYGVLMAFQRDELSPPQELKVAAEVALSHRVTVSLKGLEQEISDPANPNPQLGFSYLGELEAIATEASHLGCQLNLTEARKTLERLILRSLWQLLHNVKPATVEIDLQRLEDLIELGDRLHLNLTLDRAQELYFHCLHELIGAQCLRWLQLQSASVEQPIGGLAASTKLIHGPELTLELPQLRRLLQLG